MKRSSCYSSRSSRYFYREIFRNSGMYFILSSRVMSLAAALVVSSTTPCPPLFLSCVSLSFYSILATMASLSSLSFSFISRFTSLSSAFPSRLSSRREEVAAFRSACFVLMASRSEKKRFACKFRSELSSLPEEEETSSS